MNPARALCLSAVVLVSIGATTRAAAPAFDDGQPRQVAATFPLKEWLEHPYADELVGFDVSLKPGQCRPESLRLVDAASGKEVLFQTTDVSRHDDGTLARAKVWFWVDELPALGSR